MPQTIMVNAEPGWIHCTRWRLARKGRVTPGRTEGTMAFLKPSHTPPPISRPRTTRVHSGAAVRLLAAVLSVLVLGLVPFNGHVLGTTAGAATLPAGPSQVANADIADKALQYVGGWGGAACVDAGQSGATGGQPLGNSNNA